MILETIFNQLLTNQKYFKAVYPHLETRLFSNTNYQILFKKITEYSEKYSKPATAKEINLLLSTDQKITEQTTDDISKMITDISALEVSNNIDLLIDETEKWVQDRTMELAILDSVEILETNKPRGLIEEKVKQALSVSFKQELGMEYYISAVEQYKFYTATDAVIKCDIDLLNEALGGGFRRKAMYMFIGGTNVGKTLWMCHLAASFLVSGYNVAYITAEMAEHEIYKRIDANILDMEMSLLGKELGKKQYYDRVKIHAKKENRGRFFIKEYGSGQANRNHILAYLQELKLKKGFKPVILIADYLNEFASSRLPASQSGDSYQYVRAVTQEFRAIAIEEDLVFISPTQLNRASFSKTAEKLDLTGQADSFAVPMISDWMGAIISNKELFDESKYLLKTLKTRFGENNMDVVTIGVARKHMRLINLADEEQDVPIIVKDRMTENDKRRKIMADDERTFVFADEIIGDEINLEDIN